MVNVNKLKGKIVECGKTIDDVAKGTGITRSTLYRRINDSGKSFTIHEVDSIVLFLGLKPDEANKIFFAQFVA